MYAYIVTSRLNRISETLLLQCSNSGGVQQNTYLVVLASVEDKNWNATLHLKAHLVLKVSPVILKPILMLSRPKDFKQFQASISVLAKYQLLNLWTFREHDSHKY